MYQMCINFAAILYHISAQNLHFERNFSFISSSSTGHFNMENIFDQISERFWAAGLNSQFKIRRKKCFKMTKYYILNSQSFCLLPSSSKHQRTKKTERREIKCWNIQRFQLPGTCILLGTQLCHKNVITLKRLSPFTHSGFSWIAMRRFN